MSSGTSYDMDLRQAQSEARAARVTWMFTRNRLPLFELILAALKCDSESVRRGKGWRAFPPIATVDMPEGIQLVCADERDRRRVVDLEGAFRTIPSPGNHAGGRSQSTPPRRVSCPVAASASAAASLEMYAFVRGNVRSDV